MISSLLKQTLMSTEQKLNEPKRVVIYPEDISALTGKSLKTSRNILTKVRRDLNRQQGEYITFRDVANFFRWPEEWVKDILYVSYGYLFLWGLYFFILRDDPRLAVTWILVFFIVKFRGLKTWREFKEGWRMIRGKK